MRVSRVHFVCWLRSSVGVMPWHACCSTNRCMPPSLSQNVLQLSVFLLSHAASCTGMNIVPGSGLSRAIDYWQKECKVIPTRESLVQ